MELFEIGITVFEKQGYVRHPTAACGIGRKHKVNHLLSKHRDGVGVPRQGGVLARVRQYMEHLSLLGVNHHFRKFGYILRQKQRIRARLGDSTLMISHITYGQRVVGMGGAQYIAILRAHAYKPPAIVEYGCTGERLAGQGVCHHCTTVTAIHIGDLHECQNQKSGENPERIHSRSLSFDGE